MRGNESTLWYSDENGFGESFFIICPVCWCASILLTCWENGTMSEKECAVCTKRQMTMNST